MQNNILDRYREHFIRIESAIKENLKTEVSLARDIGEHILLAEGKRLRPLLFVLSARMTDYTGDDIYDLSVVFEYIHAASLLHDDVLDNAYIRRKRPSVNRLWGNHAAVLGGDFLYSTSFKIAVQSGNQKFMRLLTDTTKIMAEGQILELIYSNNPDISREEYIKIIIAKTATLISSACAGGAVIGKAPDNVIDNLKGFGINMGVAFQIMDDLLDYTSSSTEMGKPVGKDLREGKITLPLIYAFSEMEEDRSLKLKERIRNGEMDQQEYERVVNYIRENTYIINKVKEQIDIYTKKANSYLEHIPDSNERLALQELNQFISKRSF